MAISFVAATGTTTGTVTTATVTVPSGVQIGDLIILGHTIAASTASRTVTWPSGFTDLGVIDTSGHGDRVAWKIATSSEVAGQSLTVTVNGTGIKQALVLSSYRGTHQTTPINQFAKSTASSGITHIAPATAALTANNCLKVEFVGDSTNTTGANTSTWTVPAGMTSRNQQFTTSTGASSAAIADSDTTYYGAGSTPGNDTWTSNFSGLGGAWTIMIAPPPSAPSAPQTVTATPGNGQATVTWSPPATNGGSPLTSYTVTGTPGGNATVSGGTTSTTIMGLTNGTAYSFTVHATNSIGSSVESTPSNVVTPSLPLPSAPLNPQATAGDAQATVTWQAPTSNGGSAIQNYTVTVSPSGQTVTTANGTTLSATITSLSNGSAYTFTVHATTIAGNGPESVATNSVTPVGNVYLASEKIFYNNQWLPVASGYKQLQYQGNALTERTILNFSGNAVSMADNPASNRTDITISTGGGGGGAAVLPPWVINVKDYGAVGNGTTDDSDAIRAAFTQAISGRGAHTSSAPTVQYSLFFPPGTYRVTKEDSLIFTPETGAADQILGLTIEGCGNRVSEIFFDTTFTANSDPRRNNLITSANRLRYTRFKNLSIRSTNAANNFAYFWSRDSDDTNYAYPLYGYGQNQYTMFENIEWRGTWNRVLGLDGDQQANNNSEWTFRNCITDTLSNYTDAFLHVGITNPAANNQQDQFLNFWMHDCNWAIASGTMLLFDRGGSINCIGGSWSTIGTTGTITYFKMNRGSDLTASRLLVEGVRFEPKGANHKIIDCNWESGNVTFISCSDIAALQSGSFSGYQLHNYTATTSNRIPIVRYVDCVLAGYHNVTSGSTSLTNGKMIYEGCRFYHWNSATGGSGFLRASGSAFPAYAFRDSWNIADTSG